MTTNEHERAEKRYLVTVPVSFQFTVHNSDGPVELSSTGISVNLSSSGVCFYSCRSLEDGQKVVISSHLWDTPRTAVVRWCKGIMGGLYRVGVSFS